MQGQEGSYSTAVTADLNTGVVAGATYDFRVLAANIHGWSVASSTLSVVASGIPDKPTAVVTVEQNEDVKISWTAPASNYATITAYKLVIENASGALIEETTYCNAATEPVFSQRYCFVPMTHLISSYGLVRGNLVRPKVQAYNLNGWSPQSDFPTSGATIETIPQQMAIPTEGSATSES